MSAPPRGSFGGDLGPVGLFDLGQLLMLNRATGCLTVTSDRRKGYLYFLEGQIVNALDDEYGEGQTAAYRVFSWKAGRFEFRPEPAGAEAIIADSTEALMLEAARRIDEAAAEPGGGGAAGEALRLRERQSAMEALREVFQTLAREASAQEPVRHKVTPPALLEDLSSPGDVLVLRPGRPPRALLWGRWRDAIDTPLTSSAYEEIKAGLLASAHPVARDEPTDPAVAHLQLADGRAIAITTLRDGSDEALWLQPTRFPAPDPRLLAGPEEVLDGILGLETGVVLAGGADLPLAVRLLHALVAAWADRRHDTLLVVTVDEAYRHADTIGLVLQVTPARLRSTVRAVQPAVVAIDPRVDVGAAWFELLDTVPVVVAGLVGADPARLNERWLGRLRGLDRARADAWARAASLIVVTSARPARPDSDRIEFAVWHPTTPEVPARV